MLDKTVPSPTPIRPKEVDKKINIVLHFLLLMLCQVCDMQNINGKIPFSCLCLRDTSGSRGMTDKLPAGKTGTVPGVVPAALVRRIAAGTSGVHDPFPLFRQFDRVYKKRAARLGRHAVSARLTEKPLPSRTGR